MNYPHRADNEILAHALFRIAARCYCDECMKAPVVSIDNASLPFDENEDWESWHSCAVAIAKQALARVNKVRRQMGFGLVHCPLLKDKDNGWGEES